MQRKPGFPVANCSIKMPDNAPSADAVEEEEPPQRRQQLINFGHSQWGFNNWNWAVSKQDLDFVELTCGKYTAGVAAFVSVTVKTVELRRENVGYATALAGTKGLAIHRARKCAVTNALRETLLSFGGAVAGELLEMDARKELALEPQPENNPNLANKQSPAAPSAGPPPGEPKNCQNKNIRKDDIAPMRTTGAPPKNAIAPPPPIAKALPMPVNLPPAANRPPQPQPQPLRAPQPHAPQPHAPQPHGPQPHAPQPPAPQPHAPQPHGPQPHAPQPHGPQPHAPHPHPRPNSNEARGDSEEARAERKRRQRQAQEEFRLKQLQRQGNEEKEKQELDTNSTSVDNLLMAIPSQVINTNQLEADNEESAKRKSPALDGGAAKRKWPVLTRLDL